jgi:hypothetical protein
MNSAFLQKNISKTDKEIIKLYNLDPPTKSGTNFLLIKLEFINNDRFPDIDYINLYYAKSDISGKPLGEWKRFSSYELENPNKSQKGQFAQYGLSPAEITEFRKEAEIDYRTNPSQFKKIKSYYTSKLLDPETMGSNLIKNSIQGYLKIMQEIESGGSTQEENLNPEIEKFINNFFTNIGDGYTVSIKNKNKRSLELDDIPAMKQDKLAPTNRIRKIEMESFKKQINKTINKITNKFLLKETENLNSPSAEWELIGYGDKDAQDIEFNKSDTNYIHVKQPFISREGQNPAGVYAVSAAGMVYLSNVSTDEVINDLFDAQMNAQALTKQYHDSYKYITKIKISNSGEWISVIGSGDGLITALKKKNINIKINPDVILIRSKKELDDLAAAEQSQNKLSSFNKNRKLDLPEEENISPHVSWKDQKSKRFARLFDDEKSQKIARGPDYDIMGKDDEDEAGASAGAAMEKSTNLAQTSGLNSAKQDVAKQRTPFFKVVYSTDKDIEKAELAIIYADPKVPTHHLSTTKGMDYFYISNGKIIEPPDAIDPNAKKLLSPEKEKEVIDYLTANSSIYEENYVLGKIKQFGIKGNQHMGSGVVKLQKVEEKDYYEKNKKKIVTKPFSGSLHSWLTKSAKEGGGGLGSHIAENGTVYVDAGLLQKKDNGGWRLLSDAAKEKMKSHEEHYGKTASGKRPLEIHDTGPAKQVKKVTQKKLGKHNVVGFGKTTTPGSEKKPTK